MSRLFSYNRVDIDEDEAVSESLVDSWLNIEDSSDGTHLAGMKTEGSVSEKREIVGLAGLDKESTFGTNQNEPMNPTGSFVSDQQQNSTSSMVQTSLYKEHITWSETEKWESNPQSFFQFETEMDIPIETSFRIIPRDVHSSVSRQEVFIIQAPDNTSGKFETSTSSGTTDVTVPILSSLSEAIFQLETVKVVSSKQKVPSETDQDVSNKEVTEPNMVKQSELLVTQSEKHPRASKQQIVSVLVTGAGDHTPSQQRVNNLEIQKYEPREQENSLIVREPYGSYQSDPLNHREEEICGLKSIIQKTLKEAKARLKQQFKVKPESSNPTAVLMPLPVSYRPPRTVNMEGTETNDEDPGAPPKRTRIRTLFAGESHLAFQIPPNYKKFEEEIDDLHKKEMEYKSDDPKLPRLLLFAERVSGWIVRRQQRSDGRFDMYFCHQLTNITFRSTVEVENFILFNVYPAKPHMARKWTTPEEYYYDQGSASRRQSSSEEVVVPCSSGNLKLIEYMKGDEELKLGRKRKAKNMEIDGENDHGKMDSRTGKNKGSKREQRERSAVTGAASVVVSVKVPISETVAMEAPNPPVSISENSNLDPGNYSQGIYNGLWDLDTAPTSFRAAVDVLSSHFSLDDDDDDYFLNIHPFPP